MNTHGLHHVTAIASDAQRNYDFYTKTLGLQCVKRTVNFDDPNSYHFYFGDRTGRPGSIITFFPFPGARRGKAGVGETVAVTFGIPLGARYFWQNRFQRQFGITTAHETRFGEKFLLIEDPDGLVLEFVERPASADDMAWTTSDINEQNAIIGIQSVTLSVRDLEPTRLILDQYLGINELAADGSRHRFGTAHGGEPVLDILADENAVPGIRGAGNVHHIAFRAADDAGQQAVHEQLVTAGHHVSPVKDRNYFHSIYFREPGGVLFEIATDSPGFAIDESPDVLGQSLMLPSQFEPRRSQIEAVLPPLVT